MAVKTYDGLHTGFGCKVDEDHGGPGGSILVAYYECSSIQEAAEQALALLDCYYEVTVFSGGYYSPRSYHSKNELRRDFREWLDEETPTTFIVEWTDHEGNLNQRKFDTLEDAQMEKASLEEQFDYVAIITEVEV